MSSDESDYATEHKFHRRGIKAEQGCTVLTHNHITAALFSLSKLQIGCSGSEATAD